MGGGSDVGVEMVVIGVGGSSANTCVCAAPEVERVWCSSSLSDLSYIEQSFLQPCLQFQPGPADSGAMLTTRTRDCCRAWIVSGIGVVQDLSRSPTRSQEREGCCYCSTTDPDASVGEWDGYECRRVSGVQVQNRGARVALAAHVVRTALMQATSTRLL